MMRIAGHAAVIRWSFWCRLGLCLSREDVLARALDASEPVVQRHVEWALEPIRDSASSPFEP
jgi:hypothetical protein